MKKDVDKGTGELEDMKEAAFKIHGKDLYKFYGQSKGYTGWFKPDSDFLIFSTIHSWFYNFFMKRILKIKARNCIKRLLYRLIKNISRQKM